MPIYEYQAKQTSGCAYCLDGFEVLQKLSDAPLTNCPECNTPLVKMISAPAVGLSHSGLDDRAKAAGFSKLKRLGSGEYEKQY